MAMSVFAWLAIFIPAPSDATRATWAGGSEGSDPLNERPSDLLMLGGGIIGLACAPV